MSEIRDSKIRELILTTDGNIVIAADAGTGKTYMTVERIKHDVMKVDNYQTYAAITCLRYLIIFLNACKSYCRSSRLQMRLYTLMKPTRICKW